MSYHVPIFNFLKKSSTINYRRTSLSDISLNTWVLFLSFLVHFSFFFVLRRSIFLHLSIIINLTSCLAEGIKRRKNFVVQKPENFLGNEHLVVLAFPHILSIYGVILCTAWYVVFRVMWRFLCLILGVTVHSHSSTDTHATDNRHRYRYRYPHIACHVICNACRVPRAVYCVYHTCRDRSRSRTKTIRINISRSRSVATYTTQLHP